MARATLVEASECHAGTPAVGGPLVWQDMLEDLPVLPEMFDKKRGPWQKATGSGHLVVAHADAERPRGAHVGLFGPLREVPTMTVPRPVLTTWDCSGSVLTVVTTDS